MTLSYKGKNSGTLKLLIKYTPQPKQQKPLWNEQKGIVYPNNPYTAPQPQPQPYYNPGVQVPAINNNQGWQSQPNYGNPYSNSWSNQNIQNNNSNQNNWNNSFNQDNGVNQLLANHIANVATGQQKQGLDEQGIWGNILNATVQQQQQQANNQWGAANNNSWGSQNNGWGSYNNGW